MAEVINLRQARKARQRAEAGRLADANRVRHGQTRAEREQARSAAERAARLIDGHKREQDD